MCVHQSAMRQSCKGCTTSSSSCVISHPLKYVWVGFNLIYYGERVKKRSAAMVNTFFCCMMMTTCVAWYSIRAHPDTNRTKYRSQLPQSAVREASTSFWKIDAVPLLFISPDAISVFRLHSGTKQKNHWKGIVSDDCSLLLLVLF